MGERVGVDALDWRPSTGRAGELMISRQKLPCIEQAREVGKERGQCLQRNDMSMPYRIPEGRGNNSSLKIGNGKEGCIAQ